MKVTLTVIDGPHQGRAFRFREHDTFIVGRSKDAHFRLPVKDKTISRFHFLVEVNPPSCRLLDMASTNGTFINGRESPSADLKDGDVILNGLTTFNVAIEEVEDPSPPTIVDPLNDDSLIDPYATRTDLPVTRYVSQSSTIRLPRYRRLGIGAGCLPFLDHLIHGR